MVDATNPFRTTTFALIDGCNRGSKGPGTDGTEGDPYLLQPLGPPLEDEGPPLVGVPRCVGPYNRVEHPHPLGGGRWSNDDSYWSVHARSWRWGGLGCLPCRQSSSNKWTSCWHGLSPTTSSPFEGGSSLYCCSCCLSSFN